MSLDATVGVHVGEFDLDAGIVAADGETVAVLGPHGAGKSTMLRALAGLTPIDAGSIRDTGMMLPGNGWPVCGSMNVAGLAEKLPVRIATVGTVAY